MKGALAQEVLKSINVKRLALDPYNPEQVNGFLTYLQEVCNAPFVKARQGSLIITVACSSRQILDELWKDYCCGHVAEMAQKFLVTEDILNEFGLTNLKLKTTITEAEYRACHTGLLTLRGEFSRKWYYESLVIIRLKIIMMFNNYDMIIISI